MTQTNLSYQMDALSEYYIMIRSLNEVNLALSAYPDPVTVNDNATATHMFAAAYTPLWAPHYTTGKGVVNHSELQYYLSLSVDNSVSSLSSFPGRLIIMTHIGRSP